MKHTVITVTSATKYLRVYIYTMEMNHQLNESTMHTKSSEANTKTQEHEQDAIGMHIKKYKN